MQLILVHLVVEFVSVVGVVCEIFLGQFVFVLRFNSVEQLCLFFFIFGISGLASLESFVPFFFEGGRESSPERKQAR